MVPSAWMTKTKMLTVLLKTSFPPRTKSPHQGPSSAFLPAPKHCIQGGFNCSGKMLLFLFKRLIVSFLILLFQKELLVHSKTVGIIYQLYTFPLNTINTDL